MIFSDRCSVVSPAGTLHCRERNHLPLWNGESFWADGDRWWCNIHDLVRADVPIHLVQECLRGRDEVVGNGEDLGLVRQVVPL